MNLRDHADPSSLGSTLRSRRRQLGLTQTELADLAGVAVRSVHAAEHDKPTLRLDTLTDLCAALGFEIGLRLREPGSSDD